MNSTTQSSVTPTPTRSIRPAAGATPALPSFDDGGYANPQGSVTVAGVDLRNGPLAETRHVHGRSRSSASGSEYS